MLNVYVAWAEMNFVRDLHLHNLIQWKSETADLYPGFEKL